MLPLRAADLPEPRLDSLFPPGGKAGTEVEIGVTGAMLEGANGMLFSHPGIAAKPKDKRFVIRIAPEVSPGIYDARVSGPLGVSTPRAFVVGNLAETVKGKPQNAPEAAADLPLDTIVNGAATAATADWFRFSVKQNQHVTIECAAADIDSRYNPVLTVLDAAGREFAVSRRSGILDFKAPADAAYLLKLHDLTFAGGPEYAYRLAIRTGPRIEYVFPPCATPGTKSRLTFFGHNLPGGTPATDGLEKSEAEIDVPAQGDPRVDGLSDPAAAELDGFSYRLGASNPVFIGFAAAPVIAEQEPNDQPQAITPPCEVAGQFYPAGDVDRYLFHAKKGEVWRLEVISERLGLATNPLLLVQRDNADVQESYGSETSIGGQRFNTASNDPAWRFEVKEDGAYRVTVRDMYGGTRRDPRSVYRLSIRKESPDFRLAAVVEPVPEKKDDRTAAPHTALLRGGGTMAMKVLAFRRDNFNGDIDLSVEGLPPGVSCAPAQIASGKTEGIVLLSTTDKPAAWAGLVRVIGRAKIGDTEIVREARGGVVRWAVTDFNVTAVQPRLCRDIALAVSATEEAPVSIEASQEKPGQIALKVTRRGEFKEALKLKPNVPGVKEVDIAPTAATAAAAIENLPAGAHTIYFEAQTKGKIGGKDVVTTVYSKPVQITVPPKQP